MRETSFDVGGMVIIVTGASSGIGRGVSLMLAEAGATSVPTVRREVDRVDLLREAGSRGLVVHPVLVDVADVPSIRRAVRTVVDRHGRIDALVNNAGLGDEYEAMEVTEEDWDRMMAVNLRGLFFMSQAVAREMRTAGSGRIVNISSQGGLVGLPEGAAVYCASKGGVNTLTRHLALEWASYGITVNAIAPTFVETPGTRPILDDPARRAEVLSRIPIGHVAAVDDVAAAVIYLASPAGRMLTGTILSVDGGWTAQ